MKKVLIVSSTGMGDSLWGTPGIRALKKSFPKIKIDLIIRKVWQPLFANNPHLNKIFGYQEQWYLQPILGFQLLNQLYDAVFIFHVNKNFKRLLPWLRSTPVWCHQNIEWIPKTQRISIDAEVHGIKRRLIMLKKFGVESDGGDMEIFFDNSTLKKFQEVLNSNNFAPGNYIYLNLGAAGESRKWMVDRFLELSKRILNTTSWNIVLGGGPSDKSRGLSILNQLGSSRVIEVCDQPLLVNAQIIAKARLMVTADTGPMHIGFAMKTPIIALFGTKPLIGPGPYEIPKNLFRIIKVDPEKLTKEPNQGEFHFKSITVDMVWKQIGTII